MVLYAQYYLNDGCSAWLRKLALEIADRLGGVDQQSFSA